MLNEFQKVVANLFNTTFLELRTQIAIIKQIKGVFNPDTGTSVDIEEISYVPSIVISVTSEDINQMSGITTMVEYKVFIDYGDLIKVINSTDIIEYNLERYSIVGKPKYLPNDLTPILVLFAIRKIV